MVYFNPKNSKIKPTSLSRIVGRNIYRIVGPEKINKINDEIKAEKEKAKAINAQANHWRDHYYDFFHNPEWKTIGEPENKGYEPNPYTGY
jgi:hypothetical protein